MNKQIDKAAKDREKYQLQMQKEIDSQRMQTEEQIRSYRSILRNSNQNKRTIELRKKLKEHEATISSLLNARPRNRRGSAVDQIKDHGAIRDAEKIQKLENELNFTQKKDILKLDSLKGRL